MAGANWRPDAWFGVNLLSDPNDLYGIPQWVDVTTGVRRVSGYERGRDYELDQAMASEPIIDLRDVSETFNPLNPSSPYAGKILPYREICGLMMHPPTGGAATGNLFNTNAWVPNDGDDLDGSFESFAAGYAPNFLEEGGPASAATVTTTTPFQGTKAATWTLSAVAVPAGQRFLVRTIPGRQYTTSFYIRQSSANVQRIRVSGVTTAVDSFNGRTTVNGWGQAEGPTGAVAAPSWATTTPSDCSVSGGVGRQSHPVANSRRTCLIGSPSTDDASVYATVKVPAVAAGAAIRAEVPTNWVDSNNHWLGGIRFNTDATMTATIYQRSGGVLALKASATLPATTYSAGSRWRIRFYVNFATFSLKIWPVVTGNEPEPSLDSLVYTDPGTPTPGQVGVSTATDSANTNTFPMVFEWDDVQVVGKIVGSTTTTTGAYVRLSCTYMATQPFHYVTAATSGSTGLAGTVLLDAIQHEEGAAATAYTTAGTCIYPFTRLHAERWPREWEAAGFAGHTEIPCVDELAMLNKIKIPSEYDQLVAVSLPDMYYKLDEGEGAQQFIDSSGNHCSPLRFDVSKYGVGPSVPTPGEAMDMAGIPGGTGVLFHPPDPAPATNTWPGTILGNGPLSSGSPVGISWPTFGTSWGATTACWIQVLPLNPAGVSQTGLIVPFRLTGSPAASAYSAPLLTVITADSRLSVQTYGPGVTHSVSSAVISSLMDGTPHHVAATITQDSTNTTITGYVDGASVCTLTYATGTMYSVPATSLMVGGVFNQLSCFGVANGSISRVSLWSKALDPGFIYDLYQAGAVGNAGETSGTRELRHLRYGGYVPAYNQSTNAVPHNANAGVRIGSGSTTMQAPSWTGQLDLLSDSQQTADAEMGTFWTAADGALVWEGRQQRWLRLTPEFVLGTDVASGEIPYLSNIKMDWDPQYVYADVQVGRYGGSTAVGGTATDVAVAARRFYPLQFSRQADFATDQQAQDMADWVFNTHDLPYMRVEAVELHPDSNTALWPVVLRAEVGQRITLVRRIKQANGGAGLTLSGDFFIEQISHDVDFTKSNKWRTVLRLSPIGSTAAGISMQPWILGNATYGVLGQTTILGW